MPIQTWGDMNKSQIDSTLIVTRISEMISEHNDDPTAHMADDQSIGLHRINDVLDHPQSSVLGDKATTSELDTRTSFESFAGWVTSGFVSNDLFPGARIQSQNEEAVFEQGILNCIFNKSDAYFDWTKDSLIESVFNEEIWNDDYYFYFGWFLYTSPTSIKGLGFKVVNNVIYGFLGNGTTTQFTGTLGAGIHSMVNLRVMWEASTKSATFFVNGVPIATLTDATVSGSASNTQLGYQLDDPNEGGAVIHIQQVHVTLSLI